MRFIVMSAVALVAFVGAAQAATDSNEWSPQISGLHSAAPLAPDGSINVPGAYGTGTGSSGVYQFGNNIAASSGALYAAFQKGAFPFRHR